MITVLAVWHWTQFPLPETNFHDVMCWRILPVRFWLYVPYRWRGGRPDRSRRTWRRCTFGRDSQAAASFVLCVASSLCQPAGHESSHCEATYCRAACQWPETQGKKKQKKKGIPLQSREPRHETVELPKAPETKTQNTKKQKKNPDMSESLSLVRVSHGITQFWSHPVGHFEGIFFSPPSQSNLNNFQLHILTLNPSLMSYLCDYVSLLAKKKKKKNKQYAPTVNHSWRFLPFFFFLSSLHTGGTVFNFEAGGGGSKRTPSCFTSSKHETDEMKKTLKHCWRASCWIAASHEKHLARRRRSSS